MQPRCILQKILGHKADAQSRLDQREDLICRRGLNVRKKAQAVRGKEAGVELIRSALRAELHDGIAQQLSLIHI